MQIDTVLLKIGSLCRNIQIPVFSQRTLLGPRFLALAWVGVGLWMQRDQQGCIGWGASRLVLGNQEEVSSAVTPLSFYLGSSSLLASHWL